MTPADEKPAAMTTVAAQMSVKLRNRLEAIARADDRKLSYVIRKACEEYAEARGDEGVGANGGAA